MDVPVVDQYHIIWKHIIKVAVNFHLKPSLEQQYALQAAVGMGFYVFNAVKSNVD